MRTCRILCIVPAFLFAISSSGSALSQPVTVDSTTQDVARTKGEEGLKLFANGKWQDAYDKFREAEELYHAPTLLLYMARCQQKLGRLIQARVLYKKILDEPVIEGTTTAFIEARMRAGIEVKAVEQQTPKLRVSISGVPRESARVTLDGAVISTVGEIPVDPGPHTIEVKAENAETVIKSISLMPGMTETVELVLQSAGPPQGSRLPAFAAFGVGAIGIGIGAVTGALVLSGTNDLKSRCQENLCRLEDKNQGDSLATLGTVSTTSFILGGVGVAAGVVLLVLRPGSGSKNSPASGGRASMTGVGWIIGASADRVTIQGRY